MDSSIRVLLHSCLEENDPTAVTEPYEKLKKESEGNGSKSNVGTDLYVICAEAACQYQQFDVAEDCIKMFFKQSPPGNQYLCRAYMCQAQLQAPTSAKNPAQIEKAVHYLLKAINFAKQNSRYHFLVYNASVLYWQFCRPFLKPNYKRFLAKTLHQVVKALDDIDDEDYEWRAQLMIALIECHVDAGRKDDANQVASNASQFTRSNVPNLYKSVLRLQIQYKLTEYGKLAKETKGSPDLHLFFKIHRLKGQLESEEKVDVGQDLLKFHKSLTGMCESDISGTSTDFSERSSNANVNRSLTPVAMETVERLKLLLELVKLCMSQGLCKLASDSLEYIAKQNKDPATNLEVGFLRCELMVKTLGDKQENYTQSLVQVRLQAIEKLEQYLMNALRYGDPEVIQVGCITMWNLCLPLFQPNLRYHVRKPLHLVADALESIDSLLASLRCQIHTELAKCEEDEEQLELALNHLQKALLLDDDGVYSERLETSLTKLQLRSTLYTTPERPEDVAAMIIEQARTSKDSGTSKMKRASLVKAGNALAPDAFALVLESESESREPSKEPPTVLSKLATRVEHFEKCVSKAAGHLKRLGSQNDHERVRIWADLTKTARKQQIWDVTRVAARFCLLYDDGRWSLKKDKNVGEDEGGYVEDERANEGRSSSGAASRKGDGQNKRMSLVGEDAKSHVESDVLRILAEINLINAEALVQFLKSQDVQLCDKPTLPAPEAGNSGKLLVAVDDAPKWTIYRDWISSLSQAAIYGFQHAAELGQELHESWLVCNSAVYLLNYTTHVLAQNRHRELVAALTPILQIMKTVGLSREATLFCQVSNVVATGLMQPWYPTPSKTSVMVSPAVKKDGKKDKSAVKTAPKVTTSGFDPDALAELKQALEHLDYVLQFTNGNDPRNIVSISTRHAIIKSWVHCKQLLSQQIPKNLGHESENPLSQGPMSRCLCAVEMLSTHLHGLSDFSSAPTLQEVVRMVGNCVWTDDFVALEMWSRLSVLAFNADNHQLTMECGEKAMAFVDCSKQKKKTKVNKVISAVEYKEKVQQQLLYYANVVMGQSLIKNMKGQTKIRRDALIHFVNACRFGEMAKSYELVIAAARHYWNNVLPLVGEPIERQLLREPLEVVLQCVAAVAENNIGKDDEDDDDEDIGTEKKTAKNVKNKDKIKEKQEKKKTAERKTRFGKGKEDPKSNKMSKVTDKTDDMNGVVDQSTCERVTSPSVNVYEEDLKMRAAMYGVLFQAYADKGEWEQGLRAMDQAVKDMPRTSHRLLIFKHRVVTKSILGRDVQFDMGKFKNESELVVSSMWHHVALNSCNPREQLMAYQNAIDVMQDPQSDWQKADYLLEFGEWLFVNEFPADDATDQLIWAIDILATKSDEPVILCTEPDGVICNQETCTTDNSSMASTSFSSARVNAITDVKTLEYLTRVYIMLAQLVGRKSSKFIDNCLLAVACVQRMWKVSLEFAETISRDGAKPGELSATKKGNKDKTKDQKEAKTDKTSVKTGCPSSLQAWATFELPVKLVEYFKSDDTGRMISKSSFICPVLSVHYFNILMDDLCSLGFHHLSLPIASLLCCIAKHVIENDLLLKFTHLRMVGICQDLRLIEEAVYHEKAAKESESDKNERTKTPLKNTSVISREEIELWKEKQRQVKREETRLLNSDTITSLSSNASQQQHQGDENNSLAESVTRKTNCWLKDKRKISRIERREVWIRQAEIFIQQGHYQMARELLNEANTSALVFEDQHSRAEVLYHLALLASYESNWQQAILLLQELQTFRGDHAFWLKTVLLLVDAICGKTDKLDVSGRKVDSIAKNKAIVILKQSMATFQRLSEGSPNKACMTEYVLASLEAKLGSVLAKEVVNRTSNDEMPCSLIKACEHLRNSEVSLAQSGYKREAVKIKCERAVLVTRLAESSLESTEKRQYYVEALSILKSATELSNRLLHEVQSISSLKELCHLSLPTEREAVEIRLCLGELSVQIMNEHTNDERERRSKEARKGTVEKLIDEFVRDEPVLTDKEKKWNVVTRTIVEDTLANLNTAFSHCGAVPYLKTKCNLVLGQCLQTLASYLSPDNDPQWSIIPEQNILDPTTNQRTHKVSSDNEGDDCEDVSATVAEAVDANSSDLKHAAKKAQVGGFLKCEYKDYLRTLAQGVECLSLCVQLGIKHGYTELVADASYHLMEILGRHDMSSASLYLALFQSCSMSMTLGSLLKRCQEDSSLSRLAALIQQRELLSKRFLHQEAISSVFASNTQALGEFEAWRRLSISKNHLEIAKELSSSNTVYIILQHSKDRSFLYAATLDKPRAGLSSAKSTKQAGNVAAGSTKAIISRAKVSPQHLDGLLEKFDKFKSDEASELIRQNYLRRQAEEKRRMLASIDYDAYFDRKKDILQNDPTVKEKETNLEKQFLSLIKELEVYLDPVLEILKSTLSAGSVPETVIIFADELLLRLPLEALSFFAIPRVQCLARDLSLQMHHHRFHSYEASGTESKTDGKKAGAGGGKKGGKGDAAATKSQDKKGEKKVSKDQAIPKEGIMVDITNLRYIFDPFNECPDNDDSPEKILNDLITKYRHLSGKWSGLIGKDHVASVGEWQKMMKECSWFIFYGTQKCLNYIPPSLLASLSLQDCSLMMVLDHVETNESFLRQGTVDATKTSSELALDLSFESAALFSLTGVNCIIANQWNCKLKDNREKLDKMMTAAIDENKNIGYALHRFTKSRLLAETPSTDPSSEKQEEPATENSCSLKDNINADKAVADLENGQQCGNMVAFKNTVLYGIPYLMLNPQKV